MQVKIYSADSVHLAILRTSQPTLFILAQGMVPSSGWSQPELVPYVYKKPPHDGVWDFDFTAEPASGIVLPALFPITAQYMSQQDLTELRGVRVHTSTHYIEASLSTLKEWEAVSLGEDKAFPFVLKGGDDPLPTFLSNPD